jgi:hypothetical protein
VRGEREADIVAVGEVKRQAQTLHVEMLCLDELASADNRYGKLDGQVDWAFVRALAALFHAEEVGRPSIDPVALVKPTVAVTLDGVGSVRELLGQTCLRLDLHRFLLASRRGGLCYPLTVSHGPRPIAGCSGRAGASRARAGSWRNSADNQRSALASHHLPELRPHATLPLDGRLEQRAVSLLGASAKELLARAHAEHRGVEFQERVPLTVLQREVADEFADKSDTKPGRGIERLVEAPPLVGRDWVEDKRSGRSQINSFHAGSWGTREGRSVSALRSDQVRRESRDYVVALGGDTPHLEWSMSVPRRR